MLKVLKLFPIFFLFFFLSLIFSFLLSKLFNFTSLYCINDAISTQQEIQLRPVRRNFIHKLQLLTKDNRKSFCPVKKKYFNIYSNFYDAIRLLLYIRYIFCNHWPRCSHIWTGKSDILLFRALSRDFHASEASCWSRQMVWLQSYSDQTFFF